MMSHTVLVIPEGVDSSDGRSYPPGSLTWRETVPLQFTDETTEHHEGAFHVGNLTNLRRQTVEGATWIVAELTFDNDEDAAEAMRLADELKIAGVSADVAQVWEASDELDAEGFPVFNLVSAEIVGVTQVPMPAFDGARILSASETVELVPPMITAALLPALEADWFADPELDKPTPLTVTPEGRIYGHLATWGTCHIGFDGVCVTPPDSASDYAYFHTGSVLETAVGHITLGTGHASLSADSHSATEHYDNTGTCAADIRVGEDAHGIWVAGAARPDADLDALRAASLSGDWRRIDGSLELVAALAVNVPGFPIPRTQASMAASAQTALVASGIVQPEPDKSDLTLVYEALSVMGSKLDALLGPEDEDEDDEVHGDYPPMGRLAAVIDLSTKSGVT
jgi:hypothetical protein